MLDTKRLTRMSGRFRRALSTVRAAASTTETRSITAARYGTAARLAATAVGGACLRRASRPGLRPGRWQVHRPATPARRRGVAGVSNRAPAHKSQIAPRSATMLAALMGAPSPPRPCLTTARNA